ncbi:MAG: hypothetical protein WCB02_32220, partial [Bradyrhizobium sp.]
MMAIAASRTPIDMHSICHAKSSISAAPWVGRAWPECGNLRHHPIIGQIDETARRLSACAVQASHAKRR